MTEGTTESAVPVRTYQEHASAPQLRLPALACDSHVHVFGPISRYPYSPERSTTPLEAPKETLFALHRRLGIERCVIVQSIIHGTDNRVVEDAIAAGEHRYLGVALVAPDVPDAELQRLAEAGFRGVRFNLMRSISSAAMDQILALTPRLAAVGMHLQVHFQSELIHELAEPLLRSQVPVVIDHMGRVDATQGPGHPDFLKLLGLLANPRFHVKVSGIDRIDSMAPPEMRYRHGVQLARMLVERFPERCIWGTDWPHPNHTHIPDDAALVDALEAIAPDAQYLEQLTVRNPQNLYRFEHSPRRR